MATVTNVSAPAVYLDHDADDLAVVARCRAGDMGSRLHTARTRLAAMLAGQEAAR